jgi:sulfhydrogenase subunit beta (sulfur reductase)
MLIINENLNKQLSIWSKKYTVFAPVKKNDDYIYDQIFDFKNFSVTNNLTVIPLKKFLIPSKEILFKFENNKITKPKKIEKKSIVIVPNAQDMDAIKILDQIFLLDPYYQFRRKNIIFLGIGIIEPKQYDVFLEKIDNEYIIHNNLNKLIFQNNLLNKSEKNQINSKTSFTDPLLADQKKLANAIKLSVNDPIWERLAEICLGCGICSYVCPLCYCSYNKDELDLSKINCNDCTKITSGTRNRKWDSCLLANFSKVSQNHNFRPRLKDNIYNWYHHKFVRFLNEFGEVGCVNCGRCIKYCPAKINYKKVLQEILEKYN